MLDDWSYVADLDLDPCDEEVCEMEEGIDPIGADNDANRAEEWFFGDGERGIVQ